MKRIITLMSGIFILAIISSSCAVHTGMGMSNASLSQNNFKMVRYAKGDVATTKILGLGGLSKNAMVAEAKEELLANYPLKEGQALANMTVDFKTSVYIIVVVTKVTVTADIVEFK